MSKYDSLLGPPNQREEDANDAGVSTVENDAGGQWFVLDKWKRLERFLILGSDSGTYYVNARDLTKANLKVLEQCIQEDPARYLAAVISVSESGRAPRNDEAILALALAFAKVGPAPALDFRRALIRVCRIGTHLFTFMGFVSKFRGRGRRLRNAMKSWYARRDPHDLAYQLVKYKQRGGWSHRDVLRLSKPRIPKDSHENILRGVAIGWTCGNTTLADPCPEALRPIRGHDLVHAAENAQHAAELIREYDLFREAIPLRLMNSVEVWQALLERMPMTAMVRNLGKMASLGMLDPLTEGVSLVVDKLRDPNAIHRSRLHPMSLITALRVYARGHGDMGSLAWEPSGEITDALQDAILLSFGNVSRTGKRFLLGIDSSGSMWSRFREGNPLTCAEVGVLMSFITKSVEDRSQCIAFDDQVDTFNMPKDMYEALRKFRQKFSRGSGTDCSLPMRWAMDRRIPVDVFILYTDGQTWLGPVHPFRALRDYRQKLGINAALVIVAPEATSGTIGDPDDARTLDVCGFDTSVPSLIEQFVASLDSTDG